MTLNSCLCIPIFQRRFEVGLLDLFADELELFSDSHLDLVKWLYVELYVPGKVLSILLQINLEVQ